VFSIESLVSKEDMLLWGWRLPYLTCVAPGAMLILGRRYLEETPDFERLCIEEAGNKSARELEEATDSALAIGDPLHDLFAHHKIAVLIGSLGTMGMGAALYVPSMYGVQFIKQFANLPANWASCAEVLGSCIPAVLSFFAGMLVDAWGACKVLTLATIACCVIVPMPLLYCWTHLPQSLAVAAVLIGQAILGLVLALSASLYLWVVELFPVRVRTTGVSVAYNIGIGIFGGLGPLVSDAGNKIISPKSAVSAPAAFTMLAGLISLAAIASSHVLARRGALRLTHIRASPY